MIAAIIILYVLVVTVAIWCIILKVHSDDNYDSIIALEGHSVSHSEKIEKMEAKLQGLEEVATENHYRIEDLEKASIGTYPADLKAECISLVESGIAIREVARSKKIPYSTLQKWIKIAKKCTQESSNE